MSSEIRCERPQFQVLGLLSLSDRDSVVALAPSRPTTLLAVLLMNPNTVVTTGFLQQAIWGDGQPYSAKAALQTCVTRLRRLFTKYGMSSTTIEALPGGYRIRVDAGHLDLIRFRELLTAAAGAASVEQELALLRSALALWQGPVLANVDSEALHRDEVPRLLEEKMLATERICDLQLALGRCREVVADLWVSTRSHPGRERFSEQLVEALYRTGRQGEALAECRRIKEHLAEELGVDPGQRLQRLEMAILRGEELQVTQPIAMPVEPPARPTALPPAAPPATSYTWGTHFSGREEEQQQLLRSLGTAGGRVVVISGAPGIGKTALAQQVAHRFQDLFPGGHRLVPMDDAPHQAGLPGDWFARSDQDVPRRLLILDGVTDAEQVRPLLPVNQPLAVVITSRRGLAGLIASHGAGVLRLGRLTAADAGELLRSAIGDERMDREPAAAQALSILCDHHPMAMRIVAARLSTRRDLGIAECVDWLRVSPLDRLTVPGEEQLSVRHLFQQHFRGLPADLETRFVQVVGAATVPTAGEPAIISVHAGALALGQSLGEAEDLLEHCVDAGLLEYGKSGQYRLFTLLQLYADRLAEQLPAAC